MNHMSHPMINSNKQPMVRKMSDDNKTEEDKLIELQNYFNRIRRGRTKRTLQQPTTDYDYLNSYLANNIDSYVLEFEYIGDQVSSQYAQDLKEKLASKKIIEVKDLNNYGDPQPKKIIKFEDGSEETVPMQLIEEADAQQQQKIDFMENQNRLLEEQLSNTLPTPDEIRNPLPNVYMDGQTEIDFIPSHGLISNLSLQEPIVVDDQIINDNEYRYILNQEQDKLSIQKLQNDGSYKEVMNMNEFKKLQPAVQNEILNNIVIAEEKQKERVVAEYGIGMGGGMGGAFGFGQPDPTIEDFSETLKKDDPSELKQLGEKVKKGYEGLSKEQKAMGLLTGLDVAGEVVNYFGPARREGRQRLGELEERRERGQLGVDERQDAETMKYMTRPVRAMAEESEREQQAVMAGMGETRSAADLRRLRESRDAQMTDALSRAGQEVARQQMARKEMEKRELNQLQAYQQENLRNLTNRISGAAAQMAGTFGANVAAEADIQRELDPEMMERKIQLLIGQGMSEEEARRKVQTQAIENARLFTGLRG